MKGSLFSTSAIAFRGILAAGKHGLQCRFYDWNMENIGRHGRSTDSYLVPTALYACKPIEEQNLDLGG